MKHAFFIVFLLASFTSVQAQTPACPESNPSACGNGQGGSRYTYQQCARICHGQRNACGNTPQCVSEYHDCMSTCSD